MALLIAGYAPTKRQRKVTSIPSAAMVLTTFAPTQSQLTGNTAIQIPPGSLALTSIAPFLTFKSPIPIGVLDITTFAPTVSQNSTSITESIGPGTLTLTGVAPTKWQKQIKRIASSSIALSSIAPFAYQKDLIESAFLTITSYAPTVSVTSVAASIIEPVPNGTLTLTGFAPDKYQNGKLIQSIPSGQLRLVSFNPNIKNGTETTDVKAGGKPARRGRVVIVNGQRRVVHSHGELQRLLDAYIRSQEQELRQIENKEPKNKKKIKVLKTRITKAENRKKEEDRKWQIQKENEEILLLLAS